MLEGLFNPSEIPRFLPFFLHSIPPFYTLKKLFSLNQKGNLRNNDEGLNVKDRYITEFCQKVTGTNTITAQTFAIMLFCTFVMKGCKSAY
jgi:hypothetical protein